MKMTRILAFLAAALLVNVASLASAQNIVVGGKNFTEQQIMSQLTAQLLQAKGFKVDVKSGMGSAGLRQAEENGQIDVYWEYTGTSLMTHNNINDRMSAADTYSTVNELEAVKGHVRLNPA